MTAAPVISPERAAILRRAIGARIARVAQAQGASRAEIAAILDTTETRVARILKGSSDMTAAELVWLAKALECSVEVMAGRA